MGKKLFSIIFFLLMFISLENSFAQEKVISIWHGLAPGTESRQNNEKKSGGSITEIYQPDLTIFLPSKQDENHAAVVVLPGGGYKSVVIEKEGYSIAKWLNENGITAFVLKYRLKPKEALQDAQRALSLIRLRANEYGINPDKIGVIGFSAGGHLAANLATHCEKDDMNDKIDSTSCKPNFMIQVYGAVAEFTCDVSKDTPPTYLVHAGDDSRVPVTQSIDFYKALKKYGVPAELHVYEKGEHGFALRENKLPIKNWVNSCLDWLTGQKIISNR
jgi:acetyl esterase/lipase